jgi:low temperature requirement protein LtrA
MAVRPTTRSSRARGLPLRSFLRTPSEHGHYRVTYVELLFDLVFVFAITQLSHLLIEQFSLAAAGQALLLLLAVWWVWIFTAWVTNWIDPERLPVRALLLILTIVGLVLSAAIPQAFHFRGLAFAGAYVFMQVGRTASVVWAVRHEKSKMLRNFQRILAWFVVAGVLWIAGGVAEGSLRWWLWGVALTLEFISPSVGFWVPRLGRSATKDWSVEGGHMAERCGLFVMIALGESVLVTGATFAGLEWTNAMIAAFLTSIIGSIAMWWLYFATTADAGGELVSHSRNPGQLARLAYTYIHILLVAGIVVSAVGDEFTLAHPVGHTDAKTAIAVLGGAAIYLAGNFLFKWTTVGKISYSHLTAIATLGAVAFAADYLTPLILMTTTSLVLVVLVMVEERSRSMALAAEPTKAASLATSSSVR